MQRTQAPRIAHRSTRFAAGSLFFFVLMSAGFALATVLSPDGARSLHRERPDDSELVELKLARVEVKDALDERVHLHLRRHLPMH